MPAGEDGRNAGCNHDDKRVTCLSKLNRPPTNVLPPLLNYILLLLLYLMEAPGRTPRNTPSAALSSLATFRKHILQPTPTEGPISTSEILRAEPYSSTRERVAVHLEAMDPQSGRFNGLKRSLNLKAIPNRRTAVSIMRPTDDDVFDFWPQPFLTPTTTILNDALRTGPLNHTRRRPGTWPGT